MALLKLNLASRTEIAFYPTFLIYKKTTVFSSHEVQILYSDVDGIAYIYTKTQQRINFIPVGTTHGYYILLRAKGIIQKITFSGESSQQMFGKLVNALEVLIKPFVITNLLLEYIERGKLEIDDFIIAPDGLYKKRPLRKPDFIPWSQYYNSDIKTGYVFVYKRDPQKTYKLFYSRMMSSLNAVMLPDTINYLFQKGGHLDDATRNELIHRKVKLIEPLAAEIKEKQSFCVKCGEPIAEESQKYCGKCGSPITT